MQGQIPQGEVLIEPFTFFMTLNGSYTLLITIVLLLSLILINSIFKFFLIRKNNKRNRDDYVEIFDKNFDKNFNLLAEGINERFSSLDHNHRDINNKYNDLQSKFPLINEQITVTINKLNIIDDRIQTTQEELVKQNKEMQDELMKLRSILKRKNR